MAAELNYIDLATKYFFYAMHMDLANIGGNVEHGLHLASMGGIWMAVVYGAGGMRDYDGDLSFDPKITKNTRRLAFHLTLRNDNLLEVDIQPKATTYTLKEGKQLSFHHRKKKVTLKLGQSRSMA